MLAGHDGHARFSAVAKQRCQRLQRFDRCRVVSATSDEQFNVFVPGPLQAGAVLPLFRLLNGDCKLLNAAYAPPNH